MMYGSGWAMAIVGLLLVLAIAALIVLLVVFLARRSGHKGAQVPNALLPRPDVQPGVQPSGFQPGRNLTDDAMRILNERLARGEVTPDDYEAAKTALLKP